MSLSYKNAGVDIDAGNQLVEHIKPLAKATHRPGVLAGIGGFGGLFELPLDRYPNPIIVSSTDGVGTKLKLATRLHLHDTIGIDLVAMCVNDIIVQGAEPLFFLDYFACGHLEVELARKVIKGISDGCIQAGCALIGGETAEMPSMYSDGDYDLAGFSVGIVNKSDLLDGSRVQAGDVIIGLASSGIHSNGYSLVRKILDMHNTDLNAMFDGQTLGQALLAPTRIYVKPILDLCQHFDVHAIAHITGGGLIENIPRVIPAGLCAVIDKSTWKRPEIFKWLQIHGNLAEQEMLRTFNCGVGMTICVPPAQVNDCVATLAKHGEKAWPMGVIERNDLPEQIIIN